MSIDNMSVVSAANYWRPLSSVAGSYGRAADRAGQAVGAGQTVNSGKTEGALQTTGSKTGMSFYDILQDEQIAQLKQQLANVQGTDDQSVNLQEKNAEDKQQLLYQKLLMQQAYMMPYQMNLGYGYNNLYGVNQLGMMQNLQFSSILGGLL